MTTTTETTRPARRGRAPYNKAAHTPAVAFKRALQVLDEQARANGESGDKLFFGPTEVRDEMAKLGYSIKRPAVSNRLAALSQKGEVAVSAATNVGPIPGTIGYRYALLDAERKINFEASLADSRAAVALDAQTRRPSRKPKRAAPGHQITNLELSAETAHQLNTVASSRGIDRHSLADQILAQGLQQYDPTIVHTQVLKRYPKLQVGNNVASA